MNSNVKSLRRSLMLFWHSYQWRSPYSASAHRCRRCAKRLVITHFPVSTTSLELSAEEFTGGAQKIVERLWWQKNKKKKTMGPTRKRSNFDGVLFMSGSFWLLSFLPFIGQVCEHHSKAPCFEKNHEKTSQVGQKGIPSQICEAWSERSSKGPEKRRKGILHYCWWHQSDWCDNPPSYHVWRSANSIHLRSEQAWSWSCGTHQATNVMYPCHIQWYIFWEVSLW